MDDLAGIRDGGFDVGDGIAGFGRGSSGEVDAGWIVRSEIGYSLLPETCVACSPVVSIGSLCLEQSEWVEPYRLSPE